MMRSIEALFRREQRRLHFYRILASIFHACTLILAAWALFYSLNFVLLGFEIPSDLLQIFLPIGKVLCAGAGLVFLLIRLKYFKPISLAQIGDLLEARSQSFNLRKNKGEFRSLGAFLEGDASESSPEFREAHIAYWEKRAAKIIRPLLPPVTALLSYGVFFLVSVASAFVYGKYSHSLPTTMLEWAPSEFEIRGPYAGALWLKQTGALSGIQGSEVRFKSPHYSGLKTFFYVKESKSDWQIMPCGDECRWVLKERGQYAVGTLFARSSLFPLQVIPDEPPKSILFAEVNAEWIPSASIQVLNQEKLHLQLTASDDIRITKIRVNHRMPDSEELEEMAQWNPEESHFKKEFWISMKQWKGGQHQIYLTVYDEFKSSDSGPITILFADEETLRAKRLADLKSLIDEWVHILADLLETNADKVLSANLIRRIKEVAYPETTEAPLIAAFVKELSLLGHRIENWARFSPDFSQASSLIEKTERALLYGLSLVFQEKTGAIEATSDSLKQSQRDLSNLLEKIKSGELNATSEELQEAFKKLAEQLAELQKKMRELPSGPSDDMINREALDQQIEESDELAKRIDEIKKQMAAGDNKGAMRELESLLNQLSILSKEMERSLDQWKSNLDQGAMQSADRFKKKLDELRKREEELSKKTEVAKERAERLETQNSKTWKPIQPEKMESLQKEFNDLKKEQEKISDDFRKATKDFDSEMKGTEFESMFRSEESRGAEQQIEERMNDSRDSLMKRRGHDAFTNQKESLELMKRLSEQQQEMQQQMQSGSQRQAKGKEERQKVEILATESKSEKERRRKIMDSMQRKVDERYQRSHEQYFEEMLQR